MAVMGQIRGGNASGGYTNCDHGTVTTSQSSGVDTWVPFSKTFTPKVIVTQSSGGTYQTLTTWSDAQPTLTLYNSSYNNTNAHSNVAANSTSVSNAIVSNSVTSTGFYISSAQQPSWGYGNTVTWYAFGE